MRQTTSITIEHIVVASNRSYKQVTEALEARLSPKVDWERMAQEWQVPFPINNATATARL